jgi:hypothetical protein
MSDKHRVQFDFTPEAYQRMCELVDDAGLENKAHLLREALRLYEWFSERHRAGDVFLVRSPDGKVVEMVKLFGEPEGH